MADAAGPRIDLNQVPAEPAAEVPADEDAGVPAMAE